jgi:spore germination protein YaaH
MQAGRTRTPARLLMNSPIRWSDDAKEHFFEYVDPDTRAKVHVYFPTYASIRHRMAFAESLNAGVALWELGQRRESFTHLFQPVPEVPKQRKKKKKSSIIDFPDEL